MNANHQITTSILPTGHRISGFRNDLITRRIETEGCFDYPLFIFLEQICKRMENARCLDIGANIGLMSIAMSIHAEKVLAFEPVRETFDLLKINIGQNNLSNILAMNMGLHHKDFGGKIFVCKSNNIGGSSLYPSRDNNDYIPQLVDFRRGDGIKEIVSLPKIDVIKIDCEGSEPFVIDGLAETITRHSPLLILEWDNDNTRQGFEHLKLFDTILKEYEVFVLLSRESAFRKKTRQHPVISPIRAPLRLGYKLVHSRQYRSKPVLLRDAFHKRETYSSIVMVPPQKSSIVSSFII